MLSRRTSPSGKVTPSGMALSETPASRIRSRIGGRAEGRKVEAPKSISKARPISAVGVDLRQAVGTTEGAVVQLHDVGRHQHRDIRSTDPATEGQ